jgi:hypothetical protein
LGLFDALKVSRPTLLHGGKAASPNLAIREQRNVETQDAFWRDLFVDFIRPLQSLYKDPLSAGAHLLSSYQTDPISTARSFTKDPAAFGLLNAQPTLVDAQMIYGQLVAGGKGPSLEQCADKFEEQRAANSEVAKFAAEHPAYLGNCKGNEPLRTPSARA